MTLESLHGHGSMLLVEPKSSWVWVIWQVWKHEEPSDAPDHRYYGVDYKQPSFHRHQLRHIDERGLNLPPPGKTTAPIKSVCYGYLKRTGHHATYGLTWMVKTHPLREFCRSEPMHYPDKSDWNNERNHSSFWENRIRNWGDILNRVIIPRGRLEAHKPASHCEPSQWDPSSNPTGFQDQKASNSAGHKSRWFAKGWA